MLPVGHCLRESVAVARVKAACVHWPIVEVPAPVLAKCAREMPALSCVVVDPGTIPAPPWKWALVFRARHPAVALVLYLAARSTLQSVLDLARQGIDGLCVLDTDDEPNGLRQEIDRARRRRLASLCADTRASGPFAKAVVETCLLGVPGIASVRDLANAVGMSVGRVRRILDEAGMPAPRRLLAWSRLLVAGLRLETGSESTERIGLELDYASGPAFRNACRLLVGCSPTAIARSGGSSFLASRFTQEVRDRRGAA